MTLTTSSFLPSRRGSLRVATTVPTTRASCIDNSNGQDPAASRWAERASLAPDPRLAGDQLGGLADGQHVFQRRMRARDNVHGNQLAHPASGGGAGGGGGRCR